MTGDEELQMQLKM